MALEVIAVKSKSDMNKFIKLPYKLYRSNKIWVPPLTVDEKFKFNHSKHPFYEHSQTQEFLAMKDGEPVGRIVAIMNNMLNNYHGTKWGTWGFFECIDDQEVANALFDAGKAWVKERGADCFLGPFNFSTNEEIGLLMDAYDLPPVIMCTYNPAYYVKLVETYGFTKAKDVLAWYRDDSRPVPERVDRAVRAIQKRGGFTIRDVNMKEWSKEVALIKELYNKCWEKNWGFSPLTDHEFAHTAKDLKMIIDPELSFVAEIDGKAVAFQVNIPDANEILKVAKGHLYPFGIVKILFKKMTHKFNTLRVMLTGILPEYRNRGIETCFVHRVFMAGTRKGFHAADQSWQLEDNRLINATMEHMESYPYKRWRIYQLEKI